MRWELDTATLDFSVTFDRVTEAGMEHISRTWPPEAWATWLAQAIADASAHGRALPTDGE